MKFLEFCFNKDTKHPNQVASSITLNLIKIVLFAPLFLIPNYLVQFVLQYLLKHLILFDFQV